MHKLFLLVPLLLVMVLQTVDADFVFHHLDSLESTLNVVKEDGVNRIILFYDSLDINTQRAMNLIRSVDRQMKNLPIYGIDCRENHSAWLRSSFELSYFPSLILFRNLSKVDELNPLIVNHKRLLNMLQSIK